LKAHGWLIEIAVPNSRTSTVADENDNADDQEVPDVADFNNADNNNAVSPVMLGTVATNPQFISCNRFLIPSASPDQRYQQTIDLTQEDICLQMLGLRPGSLVAFDCTGVQVERSAPMMEQSFSAPEKVGFR
jgi:hypothetical protein